MSLRGIAEVLEVKAETVSRWLLRAAEQKILPPVLRILDSFGVRKEQLVQDRCQRNLFDFGMEGKPQQQKSLFDY